MSTASPVSTASAGSPVVNVSSAPDADSDSVSAAALKTYVVAGSRPETSVANSPLPSRVSGAVSCGFPAPSPSGQYSKETSAVSAPPRSRSSPSRVASVESTLLGSSVETDSDSLGISNAAVASISPAPVSTSRAPMSSAVSRRHALISSLSRSVCAASRAASPATCGDAIEVPESHQWSPSTFVSRRMCDGTTERTAVPGAATSTSGPREEVEFTVSSVWRLPTAIASPNAAG